jgi:hypothetical protein
VSDTQPSPEPHNSQPPGDPPPSNGMDAAVRIGVALLALGTVAALITLVPLFTGAEPFGLWIYLLSLLAPLGLAVLFVAFWQRGRSRSRRIALASELASERSQPPR